MINVGSVGSHKIEWTDYTWNPVTGCTPISSGCDNCYAMRMARRLQLMRCEKYRFGFEPVCHPDMLEKPLRMRKPRRIFVNSMGDLFHQEIHFDFIREVFDVMKRASWHQFQILTKRSGRLLEIGADLEWPENVWMGVTVEEIGYDFRIEDLKKTGAKVKFVSFEPLLGPVADIDLNGIDWVIVGGETGPGARPMRPEWLKDLRDVCITKKIPFFFKQWGGKDRKYRVLDGKIWGQMPV